MIVAADDVDDVAVTVAVIILPLKIPPRLKCVATPLSEMSSVLKATIENKTTSVTTHFSKVNDREQRAYCLSYCLK